MIRETALEMVWAMRHEIMYPEEKIDVVKLEDDARGQHWGLYDKEQLVSVISVFDRDEAIQFRKFATKQALQGKGYGTILLQFVFDHAIADGKERIWCNARTQASVFYEKFGMKKTGEPWYKYGFEFIRMEIIISKRPF